MTTPLTIQILTKDNEKYIQRCLESLLPLSATIKVYDLGSHDNTINIAKDYAETVSVEDRLDRATLRNSILARETGWHLYVHPWETLTEHATILEKINSDAEYYHLLVLQSEIITKEVRLWKGNLKFSNPAFEHIDVEKANLLNCIIYSSGYQINYEANINKWAADKPMAIEPIYYKACNCLIQGKIQEFKTLAQHYLFIKKKAVMTGVLLKYYLGMAHLSLNELQMAIKHILEVLCIKPLMAEFWCLLGDIYYKLQELDKAKTFYQNAIILGKHRSLDDLWPIEPRKYNEYPTQMIASCEMLEQNSFLSSPATIS